MVKPILWLESLVFLYLPPALVVMNELYMGDDDCILKPVTTRHALYSSDPDELYCPNQPSRITDALGFELSPCWLSACALALILVP